MTLLLIVLILLVLCGGFPAYQAGALQFNSMLGVVLSLVIVLLLVGLLMPLLPYHRYW